MALPELPKPPQPSTRRGSGSCGSFWQALTSGSHIHSTTAVPTRSQPHRDPGGMSFMLGHPGSRRYGALSGPAGVLPPDINQALLSAVHDRAPKLMAFFACMYYAASRRSTRRHQ